MFHIRQSKKLKRKMTSLMLAGSMIAGLAQTDMTSYAQENVNEGKIYVDGTYIGSGTGYRSGTTTVKVTIKDDIIVSVEEVSNEDTPRYFERAKVTIDRIVEKNSLEVDNVSGATYSCAGIIKAVRNAMDKAKKNPATGVFASGTGTKKNPFTIETVAQLQAFAKSVDEGTLYKDQCIVLAKDLDLKGIAWNPIGSEGKSGALSNFFSGTFDGQGHSIENLSLKASYQGEQNLGLFSTLGKYAVVENVKLEQVDIAITGNAVLRAGAIAGDAEAGKQYEDAPVIENCLADGEMSVVTTGAALCFAGGILGRAGANVTLLNDGTDMDIESASLGGSNSAYAGGILGTTGKNTVLANCYSFGDAKADSPKSTNYGGMAGGLSAMFAGVHLNSYATGNIAIGNQTSQHKWIGALHGQITSLVKNDTSKFAYYNKEATQTINGVTEAAIQAVGTSPSTKVGGISQVEGFDVEKLSSKEFAGILNKNILEAEETLQTLGLRETKLKLWECKDNKVILADKYYDDVTINTKIFAEGTGSKEEPFVINSEKQLRDFAASLTEEIDYQGYYITLGSDISLSNKQWTPVGNHTYTFEGTFDGQGHVVSGMAIGASASAIHVQEGEIYNGFFSVVGEHALVKDLELANVCINIENETSMYAGGITGYLYNGGAVDHCSVSGSITSGVEKGNNYAGGIAGYMYKGYIINSNTDVKLSSTTKSGYIAQAGGLVALVNRGLLANCYTYGNVFASANREEEGMACVSTLVGVNAGSLVNCYAMGDNTTDDYSYYAGAVSGWITGIGKTYNCFYNKDSVMTIGKQKPNPIAAVGTVVSAGVNEEGDSYVGGLSASNTGLSKEQMESEILAKALNDNFKAFSIDLSTFALDQTALSQWTYDEASKKVVHSNQKATTTYVRPQAEIVPEKTTAYVDGTYYGRDKDKNYVVKLQVENSKAVTIAGIQGATATASAIFADAIKNQKVTGDSALELAISEAFAKAELGDDTSYENFDASKFEGGNGSKEAPFLIANEAQLRYLADSVNKEVNYKNIYFALTSDITLTKQWKPIGRAFDGGNAYPFEGQFDGRNHEISNLQIGTEENPAKLMTTGLFGFTSGEANNDCITYGVTIKNVKLRNVSIYNNTVGKNYCGTLLGNGQNGIYLDNCSVTGTIKTVTEDSFNRVGGLASYTLRGTVTNCWTNVKIDGSTGVSSTYAGGLISLPNRTTVINCYALGDVVATAAHNNKTAVGGLFGQQGAIAINCYASGNITSRIPTTDIGALFGRTAGIGVNENCYFNKEAKLVNGEEAVEVVSASGVIVNGALEENTFGVTAEQMKATGFAEKLNVNNTALASMLEQVKKHLEGLSLKHSVFYANEALNTWEVKNGQVGFVEAAKVETTPDPTKAVTKTASPSQGSTGGWTPAQQGDTQPAVTETPKYTSAPVKTSEPVVTQAPEKVTDAPKATATPVVIVQPTQVPMSNPTVTEEPKITQTPTGTTVPDTTKKATLKKGKTYYVGGLGYQLVNQNKATVKVVAAKNKKLSKLTIANTVKINGTSYKIVAVGNKAFAGLKKLKKVSLGTYVSSIGAKAFYGCKKLSTVKKKAKSKIKIGTKAFKGTKVKKIK